MSGPEYHDCMSETYFTRALVWLVFAMVAYEHVAYPLNVIFAIINAIYAVIYFTQSHFEHREAR